jgi:hypothetical protein
LKNDGKVQAFRNDLAKKLQAGINNGTDIDLKYDQFVKVVKETATTHFKLDTKNKKRCKEWLTDEIIELAEKKGPAYLKWIQHRGTPSEKNIETSMWN